MRCRKGHSLNYRCHQHTGHGLMAGLKGCGSHKKARTRTGGDQGIEVPPDQRTWEQFPGSSWNKKLAEAQERERKRERCSQPPKKDWLHVARGAAGIKGNGWEGRKDNCMTQRKGDELLHQDLTHPSSLWGHGRWLQHGVGTLEKQMDEEALVLSCLGLL